MLLTFAVLVYTRQHYEGRCPLLSSSHHVFSENQPFINQPHQPQ